MLLAALSLIFPPLTQAYETSLQTLDESNYATYLSTSGTNDPDNFHDDDPDTRSEYNAFDVASSYTRATWTPEKYIVAAYAKLDCLVAGSADAARYVQFYIDDEWVTYDSVSDDDDPPLIYSDNPDIKARGIRNYCEYGGAEADEMHSYEIDVTTYAQGVALNVTKTTSGSVISDYYFTLSNTTGGELIDNGTTNTGVVWVNTTGYLFGHNYTLDVSSEGHETKSINFSHNHTGTYAPLQYVSLALEPIAVINMSFYELLTGDSVDNVNLTFDGENNYFTGTTSTSNYFNDSLPSDYYRILVESDGYASNNYYINLTEGSDGNINVYLINSSDAQEIDVTVQDGSQVAISDALISVYFRNGSNLLSVATGRTNIIGKSTFNLNPEYTHTFIIEAEGYDTKTFDYIPTEDITVSLSTTSTVDYTTILDTISYAVQPSQDIIIANDNQSFNLTVSDSNSQISSFSMQQGNNSSISAGSPSGGRVTLYINTSDYVNERLLFYYNITTVEGESYQDSKHYFILGEEAGNTTGISGFSNQNYSSKALIMLAVLFVVMAMLGMAKAGFPTLAITLVGTLVLGIFTWVGYVNEWIGYTTVIMVLLYILFRGGIFE